MVLKLVCDSKTTEKIKLFICLSWRQCFVAKHYSLKYLNSEYSQVNEKRYIYTHTLIKIHNSVSVLPYTFKISDYWGFKSTIIMRMCSTLVSKLLVCCKCTQTKNCCYTEVRHCICQCRNKWKTENAWIYI